MPLKIKATVANKIGFASQQNAVPILHDLVLVNEGDSPLEDLEVSLTAEPDFLEGRTWNVDRLDGEQVITDRDVRLSATYLDTLIEGVRGEVLIEVRRRDSEGDALAKERFELEVLGRSHWGGSGSMAELLPAFCLPNDRSIEQITGNAAELLRAHGKHSTIQGYEGSNPKWIWTIASAIWGSVCGLNIKYSLPPASFEEVGQKVRSPSLVLDAKLATCLDSSLLFAAALQQAGLNPLIILTEGHAFVGVWLHDRTFKMQVVHEAMEVRKLVELDEILVFETTYITKSTAPRFSEAICAAKEKLTDNEFRMAIDIGLARKKGIRPLNFSLTGNEVPTSEGEGAPAEHAGLEEAPDDLHPPPDLPPESLPSDGDGNRIEHWQRRLLDLSARNRLLNLPERAKHVPLSCPDPGALEDLLAAGKTIAISPLPDFEEGGRDAELYKEQNKEDLVAKYAEEALKGREVLSPRSKQKLEALLIDLFRQAKSDIAEGGANTLFLAIGFLNWRKNPEDEKYYRAPLILLPIKLKRRSALSGVKMSQHEDEPRFNLTLLEFLRQDYELEIPGLEGDLPTDDSGIDVDAIWNRIRIAVKDVPGFELNTECAIGTFSFSKYLMWKDLVDRSDELMVNPVVKHLIEGGEEGFENTGSTDGIPRAEDLDRVVDQSALFTPLPADSSQLAAVVASASGQNFVLDGPPGTGKSQTIANMIAHNLAMGRKVLFVAEKMAALEVVYRRLEEHGLGEFCLEAHSNKASKKDILEQLDRSWTVRAKDVHNDWARRTKELGRLQNLLNDVVGSLHRKHSNGVSVYQAIGRVLRYGSPATPRLSFADGLEHGEETYESMREATHQLDVCFAAIADAPDEFSFVEQTDWSTKWQRELVSSAGRLLSSLEVVGRDVETLLKSAGLDLSVTDCDSLSRLLDLSKAILDCSGKSLQFCFDGNYREKLDAADSFLLLLERYKELESRLSIPYREEAVRGLDPQGLQQKWEEAKTKFWLIRIISMRKLRKGLAEEGGCSSPPNVDSDLPLLLDLKARLQELDQLSPQLEGIPGYSFLSSNAEEMSNVCEIARQLQKTITTIATDPETLTELRDKVRGLVVGANDLLDPELQIATAFAACGKSSEELLERMGETEAGCASSDYRARPFQDLRRVCETIRNEETRLRAWCQWYGARNEALRQGLAPLVDAVEQGALEKGDAEEAFTTGYSRWFAEQKIDNDPVLREFSSVKQEDAIKRFQRVHDEVAALTSQYIRASLGGELPSKESVGKKDGYGILKHELQKKRAHKPLRQLASEMGEAFSQLAPCMLMSPLSIAQYLPADQQLFDLVIFDEASQITPWDAVGAMARGKQVVIAGDPRQMPPTNFFMKGAGGGGFDGSDEEDLESILDECLAVGVPRLSLNWHYRSRHESLIAFSNYRYYGGKLVTFPAAEVRESAVSRRQVDGIYAKERARINEDEAKAIVAEVVSRLKDPAFNRENLTLGVIVLNTDQQELIEDLLDVARRENREIEPHFDEQLSEPVVVKNLETVQGDERDVILLGIGYGPKEPGADVMSMNFGPLNREGGERRLNVALTRSRREMIIFTSFPPSMIDLNRTGARAVRDLRDVLDYADRGPKALAQSVKGSVGGYDSDFEKSIDTRIKDKGWQTVTQVGVSRFRVDLGVVHPKRPGDFLAGVECDGATYHSSATARDRDKVRASVLEGLGWNLVRVWSTDWFCDPESEIDKIDRQLNKLLREDEEREEKQRKDEYRDQLDEPLRPSVAEGEGESDSSSKAITSSAESPLPVAASGKIKIKGRPKKESYAVVDFSQLDIVISPDSFHEGSYTKVLTEMIGQTLEVEAPIEEGLLVTRIARAHGFKRSGRRIRDRVFDILDQSPFVVREDPGEGTFVWKEDPDGCSLDVIRKPRKSDGEEAFRLFDQIPAEEIVAARQLVKGREPAKEIATLFGIKRLTSTGKERIDVALSCIEVANY